jgi:hypothetical protein
MRPAKERDMAKRVEKIGSVDVRVPYQPPVVDVIAPVKGPAGTEINVSGEHLDSWKAYVTIMNRQVVKKLDLDKDRFKFQLPVDLPTGFHEIRVDISHLFRKTFLFEVT